MLLSSIYEQVSQAGFRPDQIITMQELLQECRICTSRPGDNWYAVTFWQDIERRLYAAPYDPNALIPETQTVSS